MEAKMMNDLKGIYEMLEDEESKDIFMNRMDFLISGEHKYMRYIVDTYVPDMAALNNKAIPELLSLLPEDRPIILYGAGADAKMNLHYFEDDLRFKGFCDGDIDKQKNGVAGYPVMSPEELLNTPDVSIVISTHRGMDEIRRFLKENNVPDERVYKMTPYMYYSEAEQYFNPDFMKYEEEEVFIDAGCNNLSTAAKLKKYCKKVKKVYAFEPDPSNYDVCLKNREWFDDGTVEVFPCGTWSEKKTLYFSATGDGSSHVTDSGEVSIEVTRIDDVVDPEMRVTFIKMDVEGSELESLKGAKETIQRDKPKLAICIYHKPEDMITLPIYIRSIVPEYKLYLRHHSNGAGETVLYAMP